MADDHHYRPMKPKSYWRGGSSRNVACTRLTAIRWRRIWQSYLCGWQRWQRSIRLRSSIMPFDQGIRWWVLRESRLSISIGYQRRKGLSVRISLRNEFVAQQHSENELLKVATFFLHN